VFRAIVLCEGSELQLEDFPQIASLVDGYEVKMPPARQLPAPPRQPAGPAAMLGSQYSLASPAMSDGSALGIPAITDGGHVRKLEEVEADMIRLALNRYRGQMSEVARKLGIGRSTLYRKMREMGLDEAKM
jgi:DNA-binding NtrC family response regulator